MKIWLSFKLLLCIAVLFVWPSTVFCCEADYLHHYYCFRTPFGMVSVGDISYCRANEMSEVIGYKTTTFVTWKHGRFSLPGSAMMWLTIVPLGLVSAVSVGLCAMMRKPSGEGNESFP